MAVRQTSADPVARPTNWDDYRAVLDRMVTPGGIKTWKSFRPRSTDVIITPYGKSGTTWLQQIVHGLRTRGDMDFDDISRVVPWIETSPDLGIDLEAEQRAEPRAFKSHLSGDLVPRGGRYVVSFRDPKDALVSLFRFKEGWFFSAGAFSIEEFARREYFKRGEGRDYWHHLRSWWNRRDEDEVLLLTFEDMKEDLPTAVRTVAAFIDVALDTELHDVVVEQASLAFMLAHGNRFDDLLMRQRSEGAGGLPPGSDSSKVRKGEVGAYRYELSAALVAEMDTIWKEEIEGPLGFKSYEELRARLGSLRRPRRRP